MTVNDAAGQSASITTSIPIAPQLVVNSACPNATCVVESTCSICGLFATQSGGVAPFAYGYSGNQPKGTTPNGLTLVNAITNSGDISVVVTDALGATAKASTLFNVFAHLVLGSGNGGSGPISSAVKIFVPYRPGDGKITSVTVTAPAGYAPNASGATFTYDPATFTITVTIPPPFQPNGWSLQVTATDGSLCGPAAGQLCAASAAQPMNMG